MMPAFVIAEKVFQYTNKPLGESGATFHRGKLSRSHCKSKALIVMDFSDMFERNTSRRFENVTSNPTLPCI